MSSEKITYIKFIAPVIPQSINALITIIDQKLKEETNHFVLLISTPGGDVFYGLTAYNYLKGIPAKITTHNIGSADSIGSVLFCSGDNRISVPHARFLLHGVTMNFSKGASLEEKQLDEKLKSLQIDTKNISKVIADTVNKDVKDIINDMQDRTTLNSEDAKEYGLVKEIKSELFPIGADVVSIQVNPQPQLQSQQNNTFKN